jgi:hypothetical protein
MNCEREEADLSIRLLCYEARYSISYLNYGKDSHVTFKLNFFNVVESDRLARCIGFIGIFVKPFPVYFGKFNGAGIGHKHILLTVIKS